MRAMLEKGTGKKCIPVWHKSRGLEEWRKLTKEYDYVAIGGIVTKEIKRKEYKYFSPMLSIAKENVATVSIYYGQKHKKEIECARKVADYYGLKHYEFDLSSIMQYSNCSLLEQSTKEIKHESYAEQIAKNGEGKVETYVPFRNGLILSTVARCEKSAHDIQAKMLRISITNIR